MNPESGAEITRRGGRDEGVGILCDLIYSEMRAIRDYRGRFGYSRHLREIRANLSREVPRHAPFDPELSPPPPPPPLAAPRAER